MKEVIENIVFLQGESANEAIKIYENTGLDDLFEYLVQWHYPDEHETSNELSQGESDDVFYKDNYVITINTRLNYCGLEYFINKEGEL